MAARSDIQVAQVETAGKYLISSKQIIGYRHWLFSHTEGLKLPQIGPSQFTR